MLRIGLEDPRELDANWVVDARCSYLRRACPLPISLSPSTFSCCVSPNGSLLAVPVAPTACLCSHSSAYSAQGSGARCQNAGQEEARCWRCQGCIRHDCPHRVSGLCCCHSFRLCRGCGGTSAHTHTHRHMHARQICDNALRRSLRKARPRRQRRKGFPNGG